MDLNSLPSFYVTFDTVLNIIICDRKKLQEDFNQVLPRDKRSGLLAIEIAGRHPERLVRWSNTIFYFKK